MTRELPSWAAQFAAAIRTHERGRRNELAKIAQPTSPPKAELSFDELIGSLPMDASISDWGEQIDELHRVAMRSVLLRCVSFFSGDFENAIRQCESPPEAAMLYALAIVAWDYVDGVLLRFRIGEFTDGSGLISLKATMIEIEPQATIDKYRVDFLLTMSLRQEDSSRLITKLIVECDGHEWHEKTPAQARRDRARDRKLQAADYPIFRYTGSEVWRDVFKAADDAIQELVRRFEVLRNR